MAHKPLLARDLLTGIRPVEEFLRQIQQGERGLTVGGLVGSSAALLVGILRRETDGPLLWIVKDQAAVYDGCDDLRFFGDLLNVQMSPLPFPHLETLPYEEVTPQTDIRCARLAVLETLERNLVSGEPGSFIIVAPIRSLLKHLPPLEALKKSTVVLRKGDTWDREALVRHLMEHGFEYRELVTELGEFSLRGGILDVFPLTSERPYRVEFFGDEIDSVRGFDPATQRSTGLLPQVSILPGEEHGLTRQALSDGQPLVCLLDLLPRNIQILVGYPEEIQEEASRVEDLVRKMYREVRERGSVAGSESVLQDSSKGPPPRPRGKPVPLPPGVLYADYRTISTKLIECGAHHLCLFRQSGLAINLDTSEETFGATETQDRLDQLNTRLAEGEHLIIACDNEGQRQRLEELLAESRRRHPNTLETLVGDLNRGFALREAGLAFITDRELFHRYRRFRIASRSIISVPLQEVVDIMPGDYVVHVDHGIGRFVGLQQLETDDGLGDFFEIVYADEDVLYVPIEQINRIGRYIGSESAPPPLSKLGGKAWASAKQKAKLAIEEMAQELIDLYAERLVRKGYPFAHDGVWQHEFEAAFPYRETPDQIRSIQEVKADMESGKPMDRLVCGDVGFGKTEVALRAAFKAAMNGKQVVVLVPTTILAQQHYQTFKSRMADFPVRVEMLSRLRDPSEQKRITHDMTAGKIDIVIGTHRLLQRDIELRNPGLVIIDEEQRFGVRHKERLKQMRRTVDCLTMTATPIPRTLYMSLNGVRDMSIVNTPPANRLPIQTYVCNFDRGVIESSILRELSRGGQVYFLHNRVASINAMTQFLQKLVPDARIAIGHGQMERHQLEKVMTDFIEQQYDILVSTTIIESGIDIPNVNTIIINRADCFGLAELYQLRGRVGRERHQAYCYLLIPGHSALTERARRRLLAIQEFNQLGSGFQLALRDLEIRGMGNILGRQQHGHIAAIGFQLYNDLLADAIRKAKGEDKEKLVYTTLEMRQRGGIDPDYVPSVKTRMAIQKRLADARTLEEVDHIREEMRDMFGVLPERSERFLASVRLRVLASEAGFERVEIGEDKTLMIYSPHIVEGGFPAEKIIAFNQRWGFTFRIRCLDETVALEVSDLVQSDDFVARLASFLSGLAEVLRGESQELVAAGS